MDVKIGLDKILFLDIETVSQKKQYQELDPAWQTLWDKKAKFLLKDGEMPDSVYDKASIFAEFGKIVCISIGILVKEENTWKMRLKSIASHVETEILIEIAELIDNYYSTPETYLCGHNGKEFDFPYIARRMLINKIPLPAPLNMAGKKPWEVKHLDTLELWKFGDYKHFTSLDLLATIFNIPSPKETMDGSKVGSAYWIENDLVKIANYCQKDVATLINVYLCITGKPIITDEHISYI